MLAGTGVSEGVVNWGDHWRGDEAPQVSDARVVLAEGGEEKDGGDVNSGALGSGQGSGNRLVVSADAVVEEEEEEEEEIGVQAKKVKSSEKCENAHALNTVGGSEKRAHDGSLDIQYRTEGEREDEGMVQGEKHVEVVAGVREGDEDSRKGGAEREEDDRIEGLDGAVLVDEASAGGRSAVNDKVEEEVAGEIEDRGKESAERADAPQMTMDEAMQEIELIEVQCIRTFALNKVWCARTCISCVRWR